MFHRLFVPEMFLQLLALRGSAIPTFSLSICTQCSLNPSFSVAEKWCERRERREKRKRLIVTESDSNTDAKGPFSPSKLRIMKKTLNLQQLKSYDTMFDLLMPCFFVSLLVMKDDFSRVPCR